MWTSEGAWIALHAARQTPLHEQPISWMRRLVLVFFNKLSGTWLLLANVVVMLWAVCYFPARGTSNIVSGVTSVYQARPMRAMKGILVSSGRPSVSRRASSTWTRRISPMT